MENSSDQYKFPLLPHIHKPKKTIQDSYLEVFFRGYQVRKNIKLADKTFKSTLNEKIIEEELNSNIKQTEFINKKTDRNQNYSDPLEIRNHRKNQSFLSNKQELKINDSANIKDDNDKFKSSQNLPSEKSINHNYNEEEAEMIPQSIRNKLKNKK